MMGSYGMAANGAALSSSEAMPGPSVTFTEDVSPSFNGLNLRAGAPSVTIQEDGATGMPAIPDSNADLSTALGYGPSAQGVGLISSVPVASASGLAGACRALSASLPVFLTMLFHRVILTLQHSNHFAHFNTCG